jgi:acyl-CoA synthetase (NDP forming)
VVATDVCARFGLAVPAISERTQKEMRRFIEVAGTSVQNPMDIGMQIRSPEDFRRVLELLADDPQIDIILAVVFVFPRRAGARVLSKIMLDSLLGFWRSASDKKPLCVSIRNPAERVEAERYRLALTRLFFSENIPVFKNAERAARALYKYTGYYRRLAETPPPAL